MSSSRSRRRRGRVAARRARSRLGNCPPSDFSAAARRRANELGRSISTAAGRAWLKGGPHYRHPVSLGERAQRQPPRDCGRVCPAQGRPHLRRRNSISARRQAGDIGHPIASPVTGDPRHRPGCNSSRPGGNVTDLSNFAVDLAAKRLEDAGDSSKSSRLAILANAAYSVVCWK